MSKQGNSTRPSSSDSSSSDSSSSSGGTDKSSGQPMSDYAFVRQKLGFKNTREFMLAHKLDVRDPDEYAEGKAILDGMQKQAGAGLSPYATNTPEDSKHYVVPPQEPEESRVIQCRGGIGRVMNSDGRHVLDGPVPPGYVRRGSGLVRIRDEGVHRSEER